tara:strand:- start:365 stop:610 length:246 start_codon:yes stop_codon:yes gene_type:complete
MKKQKLMVESIKYIVGKKDRLKLYGPTKSVKAYKCALQASKKLYEALHNDKCTLSEIEQKVKVKNTAAESYRKITGLDWPF